MPFKRLSRFNRIGRAAAMGRGCCLASLLLLFWALPVAANAQEKILGAAMLDEKTEQLSLAPFTIIQRDPQGKVTPDSIEKTGGAILNGKMSRGNLVSLGYDGTPTWLAIKLYNGGPRGEWIVDLGKRVDGRMGYMKSIKGYEFVLPSEKYPVPIKVEDLKTLSKNGVFKIAIEEDQQKLILFEVKPSAGLPTMLPITLHDDYSFLENIQGHATSKTFYCLILGAFGLFFVMLAITRRNAPTLVHAAYFFYVAISWVLYDILGSTTGKGVFDELIVFMLFGYSILSIQMTKVFYNVAYGSYTEKYILYGLMWLNGIAALMYFFLPMSDGVAHVALLYAPQGITMLIVCLMALAQSRNGHVQSHLYLASWIITLASFVVTTLSASHVLPQNYYLLNAFWYLIVGQGFFLSLAVGKKLASLEDTDSINNTNESGETLNLSKLKETKDAADHSRLLKVIEKERHVLAEFRAAEAHRMQEMQKATEAADEANRAKSAFLAVVSHEIRTPMTGVMGMVRLLLDSSITKQQRDHVLTIQESSEAMLALLNDILDFEKIQRGKIDLENISFDLQRLIQSVITLMSGHAAEKKIQLSARIGEDLPKFVKGDPTRLRQILLNLMGNAIKFTSEGSVTLYVKNLNPQDMDSNIPQSDKCMVYFAVQDSGIGIPEEAQKNLFNPFSQVDSSITRRFGGTGLGLAISKGLVENMGSSINISSKIGEGSTFFFTLEMPRGVGAVQDQSHPAQAHTAPKTLEAKRQLNVLLVDDNAINVKVVSGFLEPDHHLITVASNAEAGLAEIDSNNFDVVLMDIELPGLSGNQATRILRGHKDPVKAALPVIALTGNVGKEYMDQYAADGMSGFLAKPIDPDKLRSIIQEVSVHTPPEREIKALGEPYKPVPPMRKEEGVSMQQPSAPAPAAPENAGVFNSDMLQSLKDTIGVEQLNELLDDLIVKTDEILEAMDKASKEGDLAALAARAHELKGMAGNFGLVEISSIAAQAERKAKSSETDGLGALVETLPDANVRAKSALKDWVG